MKKFRGLAVLCALTLIAGQASFTVSAEKTEENSAGTETTAEALYSVSYCYDGGFGRIDEAVPVAEGEKVKLSVWALRKDGYSHTGWTDGESIYSRGEIIEMPPKDIIIYPVWTPVYTLTYEKLDKYGYPSPFADGTVSPGTEIYLPNYAMHYGDAMFNGWLVNGVHYDPLSTFIMPEENTYVSVDWLDPINFVYDAGTDDGVIGSRTYEVGKYPGSKINLSSSTRLARLGYTLKGWLYKETDTFYRPEAYFEVPDTDTTMYAVWTPIKVAATFDANGGTGQMERQIYEYDTFMEIPDCQFTLEGFKLLGWQLKDKYYQPGEKVKVRIDEIGESMKFKAVWIEEHLSPGDLNDDGQADLTDLSVLSLHILGEKVLDGTALENADVYRDGNIDILDLTRFKQFLGHGKILIGMKGE